MNEIRDRGVPVITVPMSRRVTPAHDLYSLYKLIRVLREGHFDLVHTHTPKAGLLGRMAAKAVGVPNIIHTDLGLYFSEMGRARRRLFIWLERLAGKCCDVMLFEDDVAMGLALQEGLCREDRAVWIGGGIDVTRFRRDRFSESEIGAKKSELGLCAGSMVVGIVARLVEEKGLCEYFEAARRIVEERRDARFLVVGPIDEEKADAITPRWAEDRYGLKDKVVFAGTQRDMPLIYCAMDLFVLPTHRDSWPRSPMEAAAMELPVIVSDLSGVAPTVEEGRTGVTVPVGDAPRLASAVLKIMSDPRRARAMGKAGRCLAVRKFNERGVFERVARVYGELLK